MEIMRLKSELQSTREGYKDVLLKLRRQQFNLQRMGRPSDSIRYVAIEESYRRELQSYRDRIDLLFPNIDCNRMHFVL